HMRTLLQLPILRVVATIGLFTFALPGCRSDAEAVCDYKCDCEGCSDAQLDDCYLGEIDKEREADNKGCLDFYDELKACEYDTGLCKAGNEWDTACKTEKERYDNCKK
ncbi:MAG TPA: hypothetical protein PK156_09300, partial [Polyangium sp.]|nr:hypothetical protein [Polyangium sp.]